MNGCTHTDPDHHSLTLLVPGVEGGVSFCMDEQCVIGWIEQQDPTKFPRGESRPWGVCARPVCASLITDTAYYIYDIGDSGGSEVAVYCSLRCMHHDLKRVGVRGIRERAV